MKTNTNLTPEKSLTIINEMIEKTRGNFKKNANYFLIWGYVVVLACILHFVLLKFTEFQKPYLAWLIMLIGIIPSTIYSIKQIHSEKVFTHIDRMNVFIWLTFGVSYFIFIAYMSKFNYQVFPFVFLLVGNCVFLSGINMKFKPLIFGGILYWIGTIISFYLNLENLLLLTFVLIIVAYLIPGYMLKHKKTPNV